MPRASLQAYRRKRRFDKTPEPAGEVATSRGPARFVVQKHAARRLHYDFRLEIDGALKSWAVPKGPSLDPTHRRLAVQTEDHPLAYATFEGTIPKGEYGAGAVLVWDEGTFVPHGDAAVGLEKGHLAFSLEGKKLRGRFHLVRLAGNEKQPQWLLMKSKDEHAQAGADVERIEENSTKTGRTLGEVASTVSIPAFIEPALCTSVEAPPAGVGFVHEPKIDGYRVVARKDGDDVQLFTRNGLDWTDHFPDVAKAVRSLPVDNAILDGEIAVLDEQGRSSFAKLQQLIAEERGTAIFFLFDLLFLEGTDLRHLALLDRKQALERLMSSVRKKSPSLELLPHRLEDGRAFLNEMAADGFEGMVSKRADAPYVSGRTRAWLKVRLWTRDDFVVVGIADLKKHNGIGALLLAERLDDGALVFRGKVGTGFSERTRQDLARRLLPLERKTPPLPLRPKVSGKVRWVEPKLAVEVAFREVTKDGRLRQASFQGIREDKTSSPSPSTASDVVAGVRITNPDRVVYPTKPHAIRKIDLARYIEAVAPLMLPHVENRPLAVVRCPEGLAAGTCFFQKHVMRGMPASVGFLEVEESGDPRAHVLAVHDDAGLVGLVQMGGIEIHPWGAAAGFPERPDRLIFDLDPAEGLRWKRVTDAARLVRSILEDHGIESFVKTTGGKGLHVVAPLVGPLTWTHVKDFARAVAEQMEQSAPHLYTANIRKDRREGRVFVDHFRNARGATAIAPYSMRRNPGAPVALPCRWDEIDDTRSDAWTVLNLHERMASTPDPWRRYFRLRQTLDGERPGRSVD